MMNEGVKVTGYVKWNLVRDGKVIDSWEGPNIVTTAGKNALASLLNGASAGTSFVTHMGFGSGTVREVVGNTTLGAELVGNGYSRVAVTRSNPSGNVIQYQATITGITASVTINEAGLFNAATGGTLVAHKAGAAGSDGNGPYGFGTASLSSSSDSLQVTWQISFN